MSQNVEVYAFSECFLFCVADKHQNRLRRRSSLHLQWGHTQPGMSDCLFDCLSTNFCLSVCLSVCLSACLSVHLSVCINFTIFFFFFFFFFFFLRIIYKYGCLPIYHDQGELQHSCTALVWHAGGAGFESPREQHFVQPQSFGRDDKPRS